MTTPTLDTVGTRARAARLDPTAAQRVFDAVLDTLARPGTLGTLDVPAGVPPALLPAMTLADVEVALAVLDVDDRWDAAARAGTGAHRTGVVAANIVVALRPLTAADVRSLNRGTPQAPEAAARLVVAVEALHVASGPLTLSVHGPGVPGERRFGVTGLDAAVVDALTVANADFPAGVDTHLVATDGTIASLPRGVTIEQVGEER